MHLRYETQRLDLVVCDERQARLIADFYKRNFEDFKLYESLYESCMSSDFHKSCLEYENSLFKKNRFLRLYLFEKENPHKIIGTLSYRDIHPIIGKSCVIGYKIDKDYRRMGYCREAIRRGNQIMYQELGVTKIEATILPDNEPSIKLLESLDFRFTGKIQSQKIEDNWFDHKVYCLKIY